LPTSDTLLVIKPSLPSTNTLPSDVIAGSLSVFLEVACSKALVYCSLFNYKLDSIDTNYL